MTIATAPEKAPTGSPSPTTTPQLPAQFAKVARSVAERVGQALRFADGLLDREPRAIERIGANAGHVGQHPHGRVAAAPQAELAENDSRALDLLSTTRSVGLGSVHAPSKPLPVGDIPDDRDVGVTLRAPGIPPYSPASPNGMATEPSIIRALLSLVVATWWSLVERVTLRLAEVVCVVYARAGSRADDADARMAVAAGLHPGSSRLRVERTRQAADVLAVRILAATIAVARVDRALSREGRGIGPHGTGTSGHAQDP